MDNVYYLKKDFKYIFYRGGKFVICYNVEEFDERYYVVSETYADNIFGMTFDGLKDLVLGDINDSVDEKILSGFQWTVLHGDDAGTTANVWLSKENQNNFKAKHDAAKEYPQLVSWPMKYKIGEKEDKTPVYEYFQNIEELAQFYLGGISYIEQCYNEGWAKKDAVDWTPYEKYFDEDGNFNPEVTEEPTEE